MVVLVRNVTVQNNAQLDRQIREVLSQIHDPCSIAAGRPISVLDMGLVRDWKFDRGVLNITFCVTFAGCTMAPHFTQAAAKKLTEIDDIELVITHVDTEFVWTPDLIKAAPIKMTGEPQAWRKQDLS